MYSFDNNFSGNTAKKLDLAENPLYNINICILLHINKKVKNKNEKISLR